jgi:hypothetical protein
MVRIFFRIVISIFVCGKIADSAFALEMGRSVFCLN